MKFNLEFEKQKAIDYINFISNQKIKIVDIVKKNKKRSLNQNSYLHLILSYIGLNIGYTLDETKAIFKVRFLSYEKNNYNFTKNTRDLNTKEMTDFIESIRNYCSKELNLYIPSPNEKQYFDSMQREINENKQYL